MAINIKAATYIYQVVLSPQIYVKLVIFILSLTLPAITIEQGIEGEITTDWGRICESDDGNGRRWCYNSVAAGIISIFTAIFLLQLDAFAPCFNDTKMKWMIHIFNIFVESVVGIYMLVSGAGVANRFTSFCKDIEDATFGDVTCESLEDDNMADYNKFVSIPVIALIIAVLWVGAIFCQVVSMVLSRRRADKE